MTKARTLANNALTAISTTELGFLDGVTSAIQTQIDGKTAKDTLTTTGDIYYASAANTPARLGIGTTSQVLTVASGIPSWATASSGGMTLLSTTTLSGASTTISSISGSYKQLVAYIYGVNMAADGTLRIAPNNNTNVTNAATNYAEGSSMYAIATNNGYIQTPGNMVQNNTLNAFTFTIENYASSTNYKAFEFYGLYKWSSWTTAMNQAGAFQSNTAITSLVFTNSNGNFTTGTVLLYGVN